MGTVWSCLIYVSHAALILRQRVIPCASSRMPFFDTICSTVPIKSSMLANRLLPSCCSSVHQAEARSYAHLQMIARPPPPQQLQVTPPLPLLLPPVAADPIRRDRKAARPRRAPWRRVATTAVPPHQLPPPLAVRKFRVQHLQRADRPGRVCLLHSARLSGRCARHMYCAATDSEGVPIMLVWHSIPATLSASRLNEL